MKKAYLLRMLFYALCLSLAACQKMITDEIDEGGDIKKTKTVQFNISQLEQIPFDQTFASRGTDVSSVCNHISLALYQNGVKVKQVNQSTADSDFGHLKLVVAEGVYKIVVIAHSGLKNPAMTDPQKISFDGKVTDTFYYSDDLELTDGASYNLTLKRAVAMFRLIISDPIPSHVALMHFYYTGGSSTFDAVNGVGCVNSRQTETREVPEDMRGKSGVFEVYTFPRSDSNTLKMQVTAHEANNNMVIRKTFEDVAVVRNMITQYKGSFFGGEPEEGGIGNGSVQLNFYSEDEWTKNDYIY
jgi:hypothetical protein